MRPSPIALTTRSLSTSDQMTAILKFSFSSAAISSMILMHHSTWGFAPEPPAVPTITGMWFLTPAVSMKRRSRLTALRSVKDLPTPR